MNQSLFSNGIGRFFYGVATSALLVVGIVGSATYAPSAAAAFCDVEPAAPHSPPIRQSNGAAPAPHAPPIRMVDHVCQAMADLGCRNIGGRTNAWVCKTPASVLTCEAFQKQGKLKACPDPNKQNPEQLAEQALGALGCKNLPGTLEPLCHNEQGIQACHALHAAGHIKKCAN